MARFCRHCGKNVETAADRESGRLLCAECGAPLGYSAAALPAGTVIAGYRIEEPVGQGGMGVVYRATQISLGRPAALKILSDELSEDPAFVESFFHEARVAANLTHPNIVQAYAAGTTKEGINYFAMEFIDGETLELKLKRTGPLAPVAAMQVALQLARALEYAWKAKRMCHGDIKPENVLISHKGEVKLADLGLARSIYEESAKRDVMVTPLYAAPELISGKQTSLSLRSDMYSYGAALYHIVVGHPPFESEKVEEIYRRHLTEPPVDPMEINPEIPVGVSRLILRLLEKDPANRPEDWTEVISILSHILDAYEVREENESGPKPEKRIPRSLLLAGLSLGFVLAVVLAVVLIRVIPGEKTEMLPSSEVSSALRSGEDENPPGEEEISLSAEERLRSEWARFRESLENRPAGEAAEACSEFLRNHRMPETLAKEIAEERKRWERKAEKLEQLADEYRKAIRVFLDSSSRIPLEGRKALSKRFRLYRMLVRQGRLPHLIQVLQNNADALSSVFRIMKLRQEKLRQLGDLPYAVPREDAVRSPHSPGKTTPEGKTPRRKPESASRDSRKSPAELNREFRALLAPHIRHFSPELLRMQMTGFVRRYGTRNCPAVRKAKVIAESLGDPGFLKHFYASLETLRGIPLSRFGDNAVLTGAERGSIRVTFQDGRITLRRRISLMPENVARLRASVLDACRKPELRRRLSADFLSFLAGTSIFYDTSNARWYVREFELSPSRRALLEEILRDLAELSPAPAS